MTLCCSIFFEILCVGTDILGGTIRGYHNSPSTCSGAGLFGSVEQGARGGSDHDAFGTGQVDAGLKGVAITHGNDVINQRVVENFWLEFIRQIGNFLDA